MPFPAFLFASIFQSTRSSDRFCQILGSLRPMRRAYPQINGRVLIDISQAKLRRNHFYFSFPKIWLDPSSPETVKMEFPSRLNSITWG